MYTYFFKPKSGRQRRELYLLLSSSVFCETENPENCWCSQLRMKISLLHRQSALIFIVVMLAFQKQKKTKHYMPLSLIAECLTQVLCDSSPDLRCSPRSTAVVFYVQNGHPSTVIKASDVSRTLHMQLLKQKADFLLFKVLRVDTAGMFWVVLADLRTLQAFG